MPLAALDLDLEVFQGPFDLLLSLVLSEEVDLLEVDLAGVVLAYVEHLERSGGRRGDPSGPAHRADLEAVTEFLVLIAALLELKSRIMLPGEEDEAHDLEPGEAAEELLARMLEYRRYRGGATHLAERLAREAGFRYRSAPLPRELRRASLDAAGPAYDPELLPRAIGGLLRVPPGLSVDHIPAPTVSLDRRLAHLRSLLGRRRRFPFEESVAGADRVTEAVTLFALLELHRSGEADWEQPEPFGPITVLAPGAEAAPRAAPRAAATDGTHP